MLGHSLLSVMIFTRTQTRFADLRPPKHFSNTSHRLQNKSVKKLLRNTMILKLFGNRHHYSDIWGRLWPDPQSGYRYATPEVRESLGKVINEHIIADRWDTIGDWWNGAFHLQYEAGDEVHRVIHHHYREGDVTPRGWSGLVYLSPNAPKQHGTTIWREKKTKLCIASKGHK